MRGRRACRWSPELTVRSHAIASRPGIVAGLGVSLLVAGCAAPAASGASGVTVDASGFRITLPAGWEAQATDQREWPGSRTVLVASTQTLDPQCDEAGSGRECHTPVAALEEGAILIWWLSTTCAGGGCEPPNGERLLVGGREAARVEGSDLCAGLGASAEEAYIVAVSPQRLDAIVVCQRDAPASVLAQVRDALDRVDWRNP